MSFLRKFFRAKEETHLHLSNIENSSSQVQSAEKKNLQFVYDKAFIYFKVDGLSSAIPSEEWLLFPPAGLDAWSENRRMVLAQLAEQGIAETCGEFVQVQHQDLYKAPVEDILALNLAEPYRMSIRIKSKGILHEPSFQYLCEYIDATGRPAIGMKRQGCFLEFGSTKKYLLSEPQFRLLSEIERFNIRSTDEKNYPGNLLQFAEIKGLAAEVGANLDKYLNGEQVVAAKEVALEVKFLDQDTIEVAPLIEGVPGATMAAVIDKFQQVQEVYDLPTEDGGRLRVVPSPKARLGIKEIKQVRRLKGPAKKAFLERPQDFVDPEVIDLDCFSRRVIDIGEFKPRFFPFINPNKTHWLPGETIHEPVPVRLEDRRTPINTLEELEALENAYLAAREKQEDHFAWGGQVLPVNDYTGESIQKLKESFDVKGEAAEEKAPDDCRPDSSKKDGGKKVLIIKENIEEVEFSTTSQTVASFTKLEPVLPGNLTPGASLLGHQKEGISWLQALYQRDLAGGLLADDMGLGKTLQVLAFVSWYQSLNRRNPVLVIAPVALLENWAEEYEKFFLRSAEILQLHGDKLSKLRIKREWSGREYEGEPRISLDTNRISKYDIVLTTYETVRDYQFSFGKIDWGVVVTDESQKIKTPQTLVTTAAKALKADFRIACTATPVENNLVDLWCILDFAIPGVLGSLKDFLRKYDYPLRKESQERITLVNQLRVEMEPFFLRRVKKDILHNLPEKNEVPVTIPLGGIQLEQYIAVVNTYKLLDSEKRRGAILKILQRLRDISAYPDTTEEALFSNSIESISRDCPKVARLLELLDDIRAKNEKAIIFTEHRRVQRVLSAILRRRYGFAPSIVNGEVAGSSPSRNSKRPTRKRMVDEFQSKVGFNVIIMSPQAAGFGLNIVEANHVIHYTRLWNPAKEDQATDRVYRIGQYKPVFVYYLITVDPGKSLVTFDQRLDELLRRKRNLATDFLYPSSLAEVKKEELLDIIKLDDAEVQRKTLTVEDLDRLKPSLFEAAVAALYELEGYETQLTPGVGDYGVDVVCLPKSPSGKGLIIECRNTHWETAGAGDMGEISSAVSLFGEKYLASFDPAVVSNGSFTKQDETMAKSRYVLLVDRQRLAEIIKRNALTLEQVYRKEEERLERI